MPIALKFLRKNVVKSTNLKVTDEGSLPVMRIWSILLIKSELKWCINLSRSLFLYCKNQTFIMIVIEFFLIEFDLIQSDYF